MRTDDDLRSWREAASSGGLPQPHRRRWQALRAGVVNLWEFEAVEYWYADGWAQLMGRNETGKSSLMALTTLIPWLGDTSSDKIDTLGRSGKQFSYYVKPTGADGDRRDASGSAFNGWLWVEYGRLSDSGPRFFTTLLHASARSATPRVNLEWCTALDSRVREALQLTVGRETQAPKSLAAPGFTAHPSAQSYKGEVARRLLGDTVDKLEMVGRILKVTRTPKLGAHLDVRFVTDHLRSALPELRRSEIQQLAQGWDQLDQVRHDLERTREAAETVARFARSSWRPWLGARLRLVADDAADRRTRFDRVRRDEEAAKEVLATAREATSRLVEAIGAAQLRADTADAAIDALRQSVAYRDAATRIEDAHRADGAVRDAQRARVLATEGANRAHEQALRTGEEHDRHTGELQRRREAADVAADTVRTAARTVGLQLTDKPDPDRLRQAATERRRAIDRAHELLAGSDHALGVAVRLEEVAEVRSDAAQDMESIAEAAWRSAELEHDTLGTALAAWAAEAPGTAPDHHAWLDSLPRNKDELSRPRLADVIRASWLAPRQAELSQQRSSASAAAERSEQESSRIRDEIAALEQAGVVPPTQPALWGRRNRDDAPGAPLWRLLNPAPGLGDTELAHVEAALAASGLLDAWVDPDGSSALDTFATRPDDPGPGLLLSSVLQVSDDAGDLSGAVQQVLAGVALRLPGEPLPDVGLALSTDGRWRNSGLTGRAAPGAESAEWIGEAAREAQRQRRLVELEALLAVHTAAALEHRTAAEAASEALAELGAAFDRAPADTGLREWITVAADRDVAAEKSRAEADRARESARSARAEADTRHAELLRFTNDNGLPHTLDGLKAARDALHDLVRALDALRAVSERLADAEALAAASAGRLAQHQLEREQADGILLAAETALTVATAKAEALRAAVGAEDEALLRRLEELQSEAADAKSLNRTLAAEQVGAGAARGEAENQLRNIAAQREEATRERDRAFAEFRSMVDRGVAADLGLALTEEGSSAIEHVRAQVAVVRREINPRRWEDGDGRLRANSETLQKLRSALEANAREVSSELAVGGRALAVEPVDDLLRVLVTVDTNGKLLPLSEAVGHLSDTVTSLQAAYDSRVQATLDELLGSTFLEHMRERIGAARDLIRDINRVLGEHATGTSATAMRIRLEPGQNREVLRTFEGSALLDPNVAGQVRGFLRDKVDEAKRLAADQGLADWHDALAQQLDYRSWYDVSLERRIGAAGSWSPLTVKSFAEMSGGARAVMLMLPLVATLAALYRDLPDAPRPIWLDEAFDGLDATNRSMVMDLLRQFDLDVLLAGPGRLVNVRAVPAAAIYQVVRAPAPFPGADLTLELWAGGSLELIELPMSWLDTTSPEAPVGQDSLL